MNRLATNGEKAEGNQKPKADFSVKL